MGTGVRESFRGVTLRLDLGDGKGTQSRETARANVVRPEALGSPGALGSAGHVSGMAGGEQE